MRIKRKHAITASTFDPDTDFGGAYSTLAAEARKIDYDFEVDSDLNITLKCTKDEKFMPELEVETVIEDGIYYYAVDMDFPELNYDDMDYSDSAHYWVASRWEPVTRFVEKLNRFSFDPSQEMATANV